MLLKLTLPSFHKQIGGAVVVAWHCAEGDEIRFGAPIVDLMADRLRHLKVWRTADAIDRGNEVGPDDPVSNEFRASVGFQLVASETGFLRVVAVLPGQRATVGEQLGLVTSTWDETVGPEEAVPDFRVVANYLEEGTRR